MILTTKQQLFLDALEAGENIFLTGKAGTGKSTIVNRAMEIMKEQLKKFIACAPTGVAANNINGVTIHSMFRIPPFGIQSMDTSQFVTDAKRKVLRQADRIFIDEVSMMTPDILDAIHWTLKKNGLKGLDKRQVIFVGDLKQLPPVLKDNSRTVLYQRYDGETFDHADIFKKLNVRIIELDEVVRQNDPDFIDALNVIRDGGRHEYFRRFQSKQASGIILAPHNATVKQYNEAGLRSQPGEAFLFTASVEGEVKPEDFNLEREIVVKSGCKIMYLVNSQDAPLRNGTLGTFIRKGPRNFIRVGNLDHAIELVMLTKKEYVYNSSKDILELKEVGTITQMPIKLAYALSIHKAQGLTFDEVTVDLTRPCFQPGQMYVALSRVRTPAGLKILTA